MLSNEQAEKISEDLILEKKGWALKINRKDALLYLKWEYGQRVASLFAQKTTGLFEVSLVFFGSEKTKKKTVNFKNRVAGTIQHINGRLGKDLKTFWFSIKKNV